MYDASTSAAIEGATVVCIENTSYSPDTLWTTTTDSNGYYYEREDVTGMYYDAKITVSETSYVSQSYVHDIDYYTPKPVLIHDFPMIKK